MKNNQHFLAIATIIGSIFGVSANDKFSADFENGMPPEIIISRTGPDPLESGYKPATYPGAGWTRAEAGTKGFAAMVCTFTIDPLLATGESSGEKAEENVEAATRTMQLPAISVQPGALLRWQARSMMGDFPESYRVEAREVGTDNSTILFETDAERNVWTWQSVMLDDFVDKNIEIAFISTTPSGFMLAVDDIFVGVPDDTQAKVEITSPVFEGRNHVYVAGNYHNLGRLEAFKGIGVVIDNELVGSQSFDDASERCQEFNIDVSGLELNKEYSYDIVGIDDQQNHTTLVAKKPLFVSEFKRNHVLDKGTGLWCANCTEGIVTLEQILEKYGNQVIPVSDQASPDPTEIRVDQQYWTEIRFFSVPAFRLNHNLKNGQVGWKYVEPDIFTPTIARINVVNALYNPETKSINLKYEVEFAEDIENIENRYRLAYLFTRKIYDPTTLYMQKNDRSGARYEQYNYLPKIILPALTVLHDVNSSAGVTAMDGIEESIPELLAANTVWSKEIEIPVVDSVNEENGQLVIYLIDKEHPADVNDNWTYAHTMLNADAMKLCDMDGRDIYDPSDDPIEDPTDKPTDDSSVDTIQGINASTVYYDMQGRRISTPGSGIYFQCRGNRFTKIIRK